MKRKNAAAMWALLAAALYAVNIPLIPMNTRMCIPMPIFTERMKPPTLMSIMTSMSIPISMKPRGRKGASRAPKGLASKGRRL